MTHDELIASAIYRLENRRWHLMNSFGQGPFRDGLNQQSIYDIDQRISALKDEKARSRSSGREG
jgi:hypothetical protein